jgi:hypothetical protein
MTAACSCIAATSQTGCGRSTSAAVIVCSMSMQVRDMLHLGVEGDDLGHSSSMQSRTYLRPRHLVEEGVREDAVEVAAHQDPAQVEAGDAQADARGAPAEAARVAELQLEESATCWQEACARDAAGGVARVPEAHTKWGMQCCKPFRSIMQQGRSACPPECDCASPRGRPTPPCC